MKNKQNQKKIKKSFFVIFALFLIFAFLSVGIVSADTSVVWTKDIGDVSTVDMSEDGSVIYAAVGSQIFVYDAAGVQQNTFSVGGIVVKLVCTADGSISALYTDGNEVYYIDNGAITWSEGFSDITDIDISNAGSVLVVESSVFYKYLRNGTLEYISNSGTYTLGVIDPDDEFSIVQSGNTNLQKYLLTTTNNYWAIVDDNYFNSNFSDFQNLLVLYVNDTSPIILNNETLGDELWNMIKDEVIAISDNSLSQSTSSKYFDPLGIEWTQATASAQWAARNYACSWVYDGKMWIGGGSSGSTYLRDVWYSTDGVTWTQATASAQWAARNYACSWVYDGKMWIGGGKGGSNDVWYSTDGVTWTQATASAQWAARGYASSWVYGGKMWFGGGYSNSIYSDVWYSTDGVTWTQTTASAQWAARFGASSWVYDDKMWIGGGFGGSNSRRDVWYCERLNYIIQPSSTGQTYIFYNNTGTDPQHTQTTYENAVPYTGTIELRTKPTLSIYELQTTKTLNGNIQAISLSDRGDWLGTATTTRLYHDQVTDAGFGTEYYAALGSTGTVYDVSTANSAAMSVLGQGQITDIYSMSASRVGTYTAGGAVTHVDIADKNALWAASGGEDGKVYVFSKDASSNWYLEYSSDSENPITALRMSARGEYILAGRTGSLTLYQTNTPEQTSTDFWFTLYAYKDSDSYRNAAVNVSVYSGNQWNSFSQGLTDSAGKYVVQLTAGQNYKFEIGNGEKILVYMASPSVTSQTVSIYSSPISTSIEYNAVWDSSTNSINFNYTDTSAQTEAVTVKIVRTDNWDTVYDQTFNNQQTIEQSLPIIDDTTSYKVEFSVRRVSGISRNTFIVSSSRDIIPIPLDQNIKNILFCGLLFVIAGLFSYVSAFRGPIVVSLVAGFFIYIGWVTIPWEWFVITIAVAIVASMSQRRS